MSSWNRKRYLVTLTQLDMGKRGNKSLLRLEVNRSTRYGTVNSSEGQSATDFFFVFWRWLTWSHGKFTRLNNFQYLQIKWFFVRKNSTQKHKWKNIFYLFSRDGLVPNFWGAFVLWLWATSIMTGMLFAVWRFTAEESPWTLQWNQQELLSPPSVA